MLFRSKFSSPFSNLCSLNNNLNSIFNVLLDNVTVVAGASVSYYINFDKDVFLCLLGKANNINISETIAVNGNPYYTNATSLNKATFGTGNLITWSITNDANPKITFTNGTSSSVTITLKSLKKAI